MLNLRVHTHVFNAWEIDKFVTDLGLETIAEKANSKAGRKPGEECWKFPFSPSSPTPIFRKWRNFIESIKAFSSLSPSFFSNCPKISTGQWKKGPEWSQWTKGDSSGRRGSFGPLGRQKLSEKLSPKLESEQGKTWKLQKPAPKGGSSPLPLLKHNELLPQSVFPFHSNLSSSGAKASSICSPYNSKRALKSYE